MRTHRAPVIAALAAVAALAAGCSTSGNLEEPALSTVAAPTQEDTAEEVVTEVVTKEAPAEESKAEKPKKDAPKKKEKCASLPKDPREQYPDGSAPGRMPQKGANPHDYQFWIGEGGVENHYDPCAPVSWIIFRGGLGSTDGPAYTGASVTDGIAFYIHGEPVQDMTLFTRIEDVTANPDGTVDFTWGERTRSTAEGITAHYTVTLQPRDGSMVPISGNGGEFSERWGYPESQYLLGHRG